MGMKSSHRSEGAYLAARRQLNDRDSKVNFRIRIAHSWLDAFYCHLREEGEAEDERKKNK